MRRIGAIVLVLVIGSLGLAAEAWAFGFGVQPARVKVSAPAGKRRGQTLTVKNERPDASIHLRVYVRDIIYLPDGTHEFPPPGSTEWSCASWVSAAPSELEIPAGKSRDVRVSVSIPQDARGGRYAAVFFETVPSYYEEGIGINFRVGALVEAEVRGTERFDASLKSLSFVEPDGFEASLFNDGNILVRPKGVVKVFDARGKKLEEVEFNPDLLGVLPKTARTYSERFERLLPGGMYRLRTEIDYGARTLVVGEHSFEVP